MHPLRMGLRLATLALLGGGAAFGQVAGEQSPVESSAGAIDSYGSAMGSPSTGLGAPGGSGSAGTMLEPGTSQSNSFDQLSGVDSAGPMLNGGSALELPESPPGAGFPSGAQSAVPSSDSVGYPGSAAAPSVPGSSAGSTSGPSTESQSTPYGSGDLAP